MKAIHRQYSNSLSSSAGAWMYLRHKRPCSSIQQASNAHTSAVLMLQQLQQVWWQQQAVAVARLMHGIDCVNSPAFGKLQASRKKVFSSTLSPLPAVTWGQQLLQTAALTSCTQYRCTTPLTTFSGPPSCNMHFPPSPPHRCCPAAPPVCVPAHATMRQISHAPAGTWPRPSM